MKYSFMQNLVLLIFVVLVSCSGADFSSKSSKGGNSSKSASTTNGQGASASDDPSGTSTPEKAAPPEEVTGAYLSGGYLACDIFNTGAGDSASMAQVGCNAYKSDHTRLDLTKLTVSWNLADKSGRSIASTDLPFNKYDKAWKIRYQAASSGFDASMTVVTANGNKTLAQDHKYDGIKQYLSDGRSFSAFAVLPNNGAETINPMTDSYVKVSVPQATFALSNYSVSIVALDPNTGFCSTTLGSVSLTYASRSGDYEILKMSTTTTLNGGVSFCLKINTVVNINGSMQTVSLYQR